MSETPAWLSGGDNANGGNFEMTEAVNITQPTAPVGGSATATTSVAAPAAGSQEEADAEKLPGVILMMRLANMGVAVALMVISVSDGPAFNSIGIRDTHFLRY